MKNGDVPSFFVCLPEGIINPSDFTLRKLEKWEFLQWQIIEREWAMTVIAVKLSEGTLPEKGIDLGKL